LQQIFLCGKNSFSHGFSFSEAKVRIASALERWRDPFTYSTVSEW
jgi:hypothetical protein